MAGVILSFLFCLDTLYITVYTVYKIIHTKTTIHKETAGIPEKLREEKIY